MRSPRCWAALALAAVLALGTAPGVAEARTGALANTAHLDFLLDEFRPVATPGHTTYRLAEEPMLLAPWTYADARDGGTFERVGGGTLDPRTGHYSQGAFNTDDIARAAVVYLRHWRLTGSAASRDKAYGLLRTVTYLQTATGADRGRSVLWVQADGTLNPSARPVELPDPSDSGPSYWQARSLWALGEGFAAFRRADPGFARFLRERILLSVGALERDVLVRYGRHDIADGRRVPAWLIVDGADATAEAVLGLAAFVDAAPDETPTRRALLRFAKGIAEMAEGRNGQWPYGALLPWIRSRSMWHAWASQQGAALARAASALGRPSLARPAVAEALAFDPTLLTAGGADNGWLPAPTDRVQIAYGVDSRVQSLLAVADTAGRGPAATLAGLHAAWFFGANRAGEPMYDPATGVTFDGLEADGRINRNSGAESTIHGLLTMLALDDHPAVRALARDLTRTPSTDGLRMIEAEDATVTGGEVVRPESAWTGESSWSGGAYLRLPQGTGAELALPPGEQPWLAEPVAWDPERGRSHSRWSQDGRPLGSVSHRVGRQGVTAVAGALLPHRLAVPAAPGTPLRVDSVRGHVDLDGVLVQPLLSRASFTGARTVVLLHSVAGGPRTYRAAEASQVVVYDRNGRLLARHRAPAGSPVRIPSGGLAILTAG